ncbi:hypothetical protein LBMAG42_55860 [Deltaproteobacteria bacterium]|nr:hypothetical protein LBMAG42_55860 [Deltaproteobacteria bacterium]
MIPAFYVLFLGLVGCASGPGGDADTDSGGDSHAQVAPQPQDGHWALADAVWGLDTCGLGSVEQGAGLINAGYTSELVSETSFTLAVDELGADGSPQQEPYACTLSDDDFSCDLQENVQDLAPDLDAVLHFGTLSSGTIVSSTTATVAIVWTFACDGADCATVQGFMHVATLPCESTISYSATAD